MALQTRPTGWHRADIMAGLRKKGTSLAALARRIGFARCTMSWALMKPHPRANVAISEALGVSLHELWPDWYGADGTPVSKRISGPSDAAEAADSRGNSEQTGPQESSQSSRRPADKSRTPRRKAA